MKKLLILFLCTLFYISVNAQAGYQKIPKLSTNSIKGSSAVYPYNEDGSVTIEDTLNIDGLQDSGVIFTRANGRLSVDTGHFIWYPTQKALAIGGNPYREVAPFGIDLHGFEVIYDSAAGTTAIAQFTSYVQNNSIHLRQANGSQAFPKPVLTGQATFSIGIRPHGHTRFIGSTQAIQGFMLEDATDTTMGNYMEFEVCPIGTVNRRRVLLLYPDTTVIKNSLRVDSAQYNMGILTSVATTINVSTGSHTIYSDATAGNVTINLPAAALNTGRILEIMKKDATVNTVTLDGNASETINGTTTRTLSTQYSFYRLRCDGLAWYIFN